MADTRTITMIACLINSLIRYPLDNMRSPVIIHNKKNTLSPISPKAMLAYCVKNSNTGEPFARYNEKK